MRLLALFALSIAFGALALGNYARADEVPPVAIEWHGPDECDGARRLSSEVERLLGRERGAWTLVVRAEVGHVSRPWHLVLTMDTPGRTRIRELDTESCATLVDAAAIIVALTVDSLSRDDGVETDAGGAAPAPTPVETPPPPEESGPTATPPRAMGATARPTSEPPFLVFAQAATDTGSLPRTAVGVQAGLGYAARPFRLEGTLGYWPSVSSTVAGSPSIGSTFSAFVAAVRGCAVAELARAQWLSLGGCAGGSSTTMQAEAFGVTTSLSASSSWASFVADALVLGRISSAFAVRANAGLSAPFTRPTFEIEGIGVVHQPAPVALELAAGVEAHF